MNAVDFDLNTLTAEFKQAMQDLYGDRLASVILYGSYARVDFHAVSDVDFMVVLEGSKLKPLHEIERTPDVVVHLLDKYERLVSPMMTTEDIYTNSDFLLYRNVKKDGITI